MGLIRIPGFPGLVNEADIRPCGDCGGCRFWIGRDRMGGRLACVNCLPPKKGEQTFGVVDMVKREVRLSQGR